MRPCLPGLVALLRWPAMGAVALAVTAAAAQGSHDGVARFVGRAAEQARDPDELAALAAQRANGYAGVHVRSDGQIEVLFTPRSELFGAGGRASDWLGQPTAPAQLARALGARHLRQVEFDAIELLAWKRRARPLLEFRPVHWIDIDEAANRLVVGIEVQAPAHQEAEVRRQLRAAGIPARAIDVVREAPAVTYQQVGESLQFQVPPLAGGAKLVLFEGETEQSQSKCTITAAVRRDGKAGYLTASHCSAVMFGLDAPGSNYRVKSPSGDWVSAGGEVIDPAPRAGGCPWRIAAVPAVLARWTGARATCRFSDAGFATASAPADVALGQLLHAPRVPVGSPEAPVADAVAELAGTESFALQGARVEKVGMKTGTTQGRVTRTCVDTRVTHQNEQTDKVLLCQWKARLYARKGDSGAPVVVWERLANRFLLAGVLSTGPSDEPATEAEAQMMEIGFSPWGSVAWELGGQWDVAAP